MFYVRSVPDEKPGDGGMQSPDHRGETLARGRPHDEGPRVRDLGRERDVRLPKAASSPGSEKPITEVASDDDVRVENTDQSGPTEAAHGRAGF